MPNLSNAYLSNQSVDLTDITVAWYNTICPDAIQIQTTMETLVETICDSFVILTNHRVNAQTL